MNSSPRQKWAVIAVTLILLGLLSYLTAAMFSLFLDSDTASFGNVALIKIEGTIMGADYNDLLSQQIANSQDIVRHIKSADKNPAIKAILFEINSGGGTAVASKEIADAVKRAEKPTFALIREIGTSGAYWVASATDEIVASELSITGSIGVIASYLEFSDLFDKYGITYQRLVAGKYKDIGSSFRELESDEELILQSQINKIHEYFVRQVAENRNLEYGYVANISTGLFYLGLDAKEMGLVDHLGDIETAKSIIMERVNITEVQFSEYKKPRTFLDVLSEVFSDQSFRVGQGIGSSFLAKTGEGIMT